MATLDTVVGVKSITTDADEPVPTRGTLHVTGPTASVFDDPGNAETIFNLASLEGTPGSAVTSEQLEADVLRLDIDGQDAANVVRLTIGESLAIHSIAKPTIAGNPRKTLVLLQGGEGRLELKHQSMSASADERLVAPGAASYFLLQNSSIDVLYDSVGDRWMVIP